MLRYVASNKLHQEDYWRDFVAVWCMAHANSYFLETLFLSNSDFYSVRASPCNKHQHCHFAD